MKKMLAVSLAVVILIVMCACNQTSSSSSSGSSSASGAGGSSSSSSEVIQPSEPVVLKVMAPDNVAIEDYNTNLTTLYIEEQLGVDLQFEVAASTDYSTKLNLIVQAGDDLPDIVFGALSDSMVLSWASEGAILPLNEYYENPETSANIREAIVRTGQDYTKQLTMPDGKIYGVATYNQSYGNEYESKLFVLQSWIDDLGMDIPKTTEDFYDLTLAVAKNDLNNNGRSDEIALAGYNGIYYTWFSYLMGSFVYADFKNDYLMVEDGTLSYAYTTDAWKEGVKYIRKLVDDGILTTESITMDYNQYMNFINTEEDLLFGMFLVSTSYVTAKDARRDDYVGIPPMIGPEGVQTSHYNPSKASVQMVISSNCENPEMAFRVGDLMSGEYLSIVTRWGEEGVDWDYWENAKVDNKSAYSAYVPGFDIFMIAYADEVFWTSAHMQNSSYKQNGPFVRQYGIANGRAANPDTMAPYVYQEADANTLYQTGGFAPNEVIAKLIYTEEESAELSELTASLKNYVSSTMGSYLTRALDVDQHWDAFVEELNKIGIKRALEIIQGVYDRMYK